MLCIPRYGNYLLTAPASREGRRKTSNDEEEDERDAKETEDVDEEAVKAGGAPRLPRRLKVVDGRYDVSELLAAANTLTNPAAGKDRGEL